MALQDAMWVCNPKIRIISATSFPSMPEVSQVRTILTRINTAAPSIYVPAVFLLLLLPSLKRKPMALIKNLRKATCACTISGEENEQIDGALVLSIEKLQEILDELQKVSLLNFFVCVPASSPA